MGKLSRSRLHCYVLLGCFATGLSVSASVTSASAQAPTQIKAPEVPQVTVPQVMVPKVTVPQVTVPPVNLPEVRVPEVKTPVVTVPEVKAPSVNTPEVKTPNVALPNPTNPTEDNTGNGNTSGGSNSGDTSNGNTNGGNNSGDTSGGGNNLDSDASSSNASGRNGSRPGSNANGGEGPSPVESQTERRARPIQNDQRPVQQRRSEPSLLNQTGASSTQAESPAPNANLLRDVIDFIPLPIKLILALLTLVALLLGLKSWLAGRDAKRLVAQRELLLQDIGLLSSALLPDIDPRFETLALGAAYRPANGPGAGGDFYDAFPLNDGRLGLLLGDVSGHGREALGYTALARHTLRAYMEAGMQPRAALQIGSTVLDRHLHEGFTTVISAIYDPVTNRLTYASAGHPRPVFIGMEAPLELAEYSSPPMGAGFPTGKRQTSVVLGSGAGVCFFTDGLFEAKTASGEWLGRERVEEIIRGLPQGHGGTEILTVIAEEAETVPDDMAALVVWQESAEKLSAAKCYEELEVETPEEALSFIELAPSDQRQELQAKITATLSHYEVAVVRLICQNGQIETAEIFPREPSPFAVVLSADS